MINEYRKVGLFGGTFDPVHIGHLFLAEAALDKFDLDRVLFMPDPLPYHRSKADISSLEDRINMTKLAIEDNPLFEYCDFEINLPGQSYTSKTLEAFKESFPDTKLYFILGGDSLFSIEYWKDPDKIFSMAVILSGKREGQIKGATGFLHPDYANVNQSEAKDNENANDRLDDKIEELKSRYSAEIYNLYVPNIEVSSSDIKKRVKEGRTIKYFTPDKVAEYIYSKGLYK